MNKLATCIYKGFLDYRINVYKESYSDAVVALEDARDQLFEDLANEFKTKGKFTFSRDEKTLEAFAHVHNYIQNNYKEES